MGTPICIRRDEWICHYDTYEAPENFVRTPVCGIFPTSRFVEIFLHTVDYQCGENSFKDRFVKFLKESLKGNSQ
jgi:hypothetical protein